MMTLITVTVTLTLMVAEIRRIQHAEVSFFFFLPLVAAIMLVHAVPWSWALAPGHRYHPGHGRQLRRTERVRAQRTCRGPPG